jgi:hypothetical protein
MQVAQSDTQFKQNKLIYRMLEKPSQRVLSALSTLEGNPDFEEIKGWLSENLQQLYTDSISTQDDTMCRWRQGAAQVVADFLKKANTAREVLNKSR